MKKTTMIHLALLLLLSVVGSAQAQTPAKKDNQAVLKFTEAPTTAHLVKILTLNGYTCEDVNTDFGIINTNYKPTTKPAISVRFNLTIMGNMVYLQGQWLNDGMPNAPEPITFTKWPVDKLAWEYLTNLINALNPESYEFKRL